MALAGKTPINQMFDERWITENTHLCKINTIRYDDKLNPGVLTARDYILSLTKAFNATQRTVKFSQFQWVQHTADAEDGTTFDPTDEQILASKYYLFGLRLGKADAPYKIAVICHLDTVPADSDSGEWDPFNPHVEQREYDGAGTSNPQDFLVGRGCVDDKGPAVSAFLVGRALALKYDGTDAFENVALELLFDSSEETEMATPKYLVDPLSLPPHFGIVFDAFWCTRAEKGAERPVFTVHAMDQPADGALYLDKLISNPDNSTNTIPDWASADIRSSDTDKLAAFAAQVESLYSSYVFDDPTYQRAPLEVSTEEEGVVRLRTTVKGAQHGSSPQENREEGWSPLVSLSNFLAGLQRDATLAPTAAGTMCLFIEFMWGTKVFGENHTALEGSDQIFEGPENGTSYAVSRMTDGEHGAGSSTLALDIRYALAHHSVEWDGVTEGYVGEGEPSILPGIFDTLVKQFNGDNTGLGDVSFHSSTPFAPDVRVPETNENFKKVTQAFTDVHGKEPPMLAIGGGTDAKGMTNLLAVGPLFCTKMGPPVNYHGISEGAPIEDMRESTAILYRIMELEVENPPMSKLEFYARRLRSVLETVRKSHARGYKYRCNH